MSARLRARRAGRAAISRRTFLRGGLQGAGVLAAGLVGAQLGPRAARAAFSGADSFGPLQPPDTNGLMLPAGFSSRVVARADEPPVAGGSYPWHRNPDGGACFASGDGGWIYVSNSETDAPGGGVSALRFAPDGAIVDAYSILSGTSRNCAGGATPWGTWLSCEEVTSGQVFECDPFAASQGVVRPALGSFRHEAAAVDPANEHVYLTEDQPGGRLYRFAPASYPDLSAGLLEVAQIDGPGAIQPGQLRALDWLAASSTQATSFNGGEGCAYHDGRIYFATKGDSRVWLIDANADTIEIYYDRTTSADPELTNVDNVYVSPAGDVLVAEDPGDLQIVALTPSGDVKPIVQLTGQSGTEITGPALSPDGRRLYFSSQRGPVTSGNRGLTYEVTGPFIAVEVPLLDPLWRSLLAGVLGATAAFALRDRGR